MCLSVGDTLLTLHLPTTAWVAGHTFTEHVHAAVPYIRQTHDFSLTVTSAGSHLRSKRTSQVQKAVSLDVLLQIAAERLAGLNPRLYNFQVGNFDYTDDELHLGQLAGV